MKKQPDSESLINGYKRIKDLETLLSSKENQEWQKLIQSPAIIEKKLNQILKSTDHQKAKQECSKLITEIDGLIHLAAHHKFLNGQSVRIWSVLKNIQDTISKFSDSL